MSSPDRDFVNQETTGATIPQMLRTLLHLWGRYRAAQAAGEEPWDFAVAETAMHETGVTKQELQRLIERHYIEYVTRSAPAPAHGNTKAPTGPPPFDVRYFVLAPAGVAFLEKITDIVEQDEETVLRRDEAAKDSKPHWDPQRRELCYRGVVVKRFHKPAPNQELILAAFEESNWPQRIDDPLPPQGDILPSVRLHNTLGRLNRSLQHTLLQFGVERKGQGVYWRPT